MQTLMKTNGKDSKLTWSVIVKRKTAFDAMPYCVEDLYYPANDTERSKLNWSPFDRGFNCAQGFLLCKSQSFFCFFCSFK